MVSAIISRVVILVFGTLYPAYASYKAVRTKNVKEYVKWMMYWIVFALFCCIETFSDVFLSWLPFYYELKIVFVIWMLSPLTQGSSFIFKKFVHPQLARREKEIDEMITQASKQGYSTLLSLGSKGVNYASQMVMKTAIMGQSKLVDHLRRSYSTSDLTDDGQSVMQRHEAVGGGDEGDDELDNRLIEDNAELQMRTTSSKAKLSRSKSSASSYSLSSVKEEDNEGEEEERVITETFAIPVSSRKPLTAKEDFLLRAQRLARCQSLPPPITDKKTSFPPHTTSSVQSTLQSKRQYFASNRFNAKSFDEESGNGVVMKKKTGADLSGAISSTVQKKRDLFTRAHSQDNIIIQRSKPQVIAGLNTQARKRLLLQRAQSEEPIDRHKPGSSCYRRPFTQHDTVRRTQITVPIKKEKDISSNDDRKILLSDENLMEKSASKGEMNDDKEVFMHSAKPIDKSKNLNELTLLSDKEDWISIEDDDTDEDSLIFCEIDSADDDSDDSPVEYTSVVPYSPEVEWDRNSSSDIIIIDSPKLIRLKKQISSRDGDSETVEAGSNVDDFILKREMIFQESEKSAHPVKRILSYDESLEESEGNKMHVEQTHIASSIQSIHNRKNPNTRPFQFKGSKFPKLEEGHPHSAPTSPATSRTKQPGRAYYTMDPSLGSWRMELSSRRLYASTPDTRPELFRLAQTSSSPLAQDTRNVPHSTQGSHASTGSLKDREYSISASVASNEETSENPFVSPLSPIERPRAKSLSMEREHFRGCYARRMSQEMSSSPFAPSKKNI